MPCEDYPCCGHEWGDCEGQKYGSDESIKAAVYRRCSNCGAPAGCECRHDYGCIDSDRR